MKMMYAVLTALLAAVPCFAGDIHVAPGKGTISAVASAARADDVIVLSEGEYEDSVNLPAGVTLRGAGADKTTFKPTKPVAIQCAGPRVTVTDLTIQGDGDTLRGINTDSAVRVERVRFKSIREGVALMGAPLSDVLSCEFIDCGIGVRAIAEASPTVIACGFRGGRIGVFSMGGAPIVRNNAFVELQEGVRIVARGSNQPILRNNIFLGCKSAGVFVAQGPDAVFPPIIRNSIFADSPAAIMIPRVAIPGSIGFGIIHNVPAPPIKDEKGTSSLDAAAASFQLADPQTTISPEFEIRFKDRSIVTGKGLRLASAPKGTNCDLGPTLTQLGVKATLSPDAAPVRWKSPAFISNSVSEQYQAMAMLDFTSATQSVERGQAGPKDVHTSADGSVISFDISRFFGEQSIED